MSTTLFIAPTGARNKRESIFRELVSLCPGNDFSSIQYICPNSFVVSEAERAFHHFLKRPAYIPFQTATLKNLAQKLHAETSRNGLVSEPVRPLILCEILGQSSSGYARILSDLYGKIKHYLPYKDLLQIKNEIASLVFEEKTAQRASDAIDTLISYEQSLKKKGLSDTEGMMEKSVSLIGNHFRAVILVVDGFYDPTPLEIKIIRALIDVSRNAFMLAEEQSGLAKEFVHDTTDMTRKRLPASRSRAKTGYVVYPSMEDEVESIARSVKGLVLEGTSPADIIVTFPAMERYLPLLRRVFRKHGIPLNAAEHDFSTSRPIVALDDLITCVEDDYPAVAFLSFITSPSCSRLPPVLKERAVTLSYRAGIVKGRQSWIGLKDTIRNSPTGSVSASDTDMLNAFQKELNALISAIEDIKKQKGLTSFIAELERALTQFGFFSSLTETEGHAEGTRLGNQLQRLFTDLKKFAALYGLDRQVSVSPGFHLRHMLNDLKVFGERGDGVSAVPLESAAGLEARALFFGGMTEEAFPSKPPVDPLLPERAKKTLGLPYLEYYLERQKRNFKRILNISMIDPCISFPSADGDKLFIPSPYLDWETEMPPLSPDIFSEEDLMIMDASMYGSRPGSGMLRDGDLFAATEPFGSIVPDRTVFKDYMSVSDIEAYRKCPRRFYLERVLRLEIEEPAKFEVEARVWGTLAHKVMEYLFKDGDIDLQSLEERVFEGLRTYMKQYPLGDFWSRVAEEIFQRLLPSILEEEAKIRAEGFIPHAVEEKIKAQIGGLKLKGKLDRVDIKKQGSGAGVQGAEKTSSGQRIADNGGTVRIIDYKTGTPDRDSLQLPLYAAMWEETHAQGVEGLGMYSLKDGHVTWYPQRKNMDEYIEEKLRIAGKLVEGISRGHYPPTPHSAQECRYCYHRSVCETKI